MQDEDRVEPNICMHVHSGREKAKHETVVSMEVPFVYIGPSRGGKVLYA